MEGNLDEVFIYIVLEYVLEYWFGGCVEKGFRWFMEDVYLCVDDLEEILGCWGVFYGVGIWVISVVYDLFIEVLCMYVL